MNFHGHDAKRIGGGTGPGTEPIAQLQFLVTDRFLKMNVDETYQFLFQAFDLDVKIRQPVFEKGIMKNCRPRLFFFPYLSFLRKQESRVCILVKRRKKDTGSSIKDVEDDRQRQKQKTKTLDP